MRKKGSPKNPESSRHAFVPGTKSGKRRPRRYTRRNRIFFGRDRADAQVVGQGVVFCPYTLQRALYGGKVSEAGIGVLS